MDNMKYRWSLKFETSQGVVWYRATCALSEAGFTPLFPTKREAEDYKRARCPGSNWVVARLKVSE